MKLLALLLPLAFIASTAQAVDVCTDTYCQGQLDLVYVHEISGGVVFVRPKADLAPLQCTPHSGEFLRLNSTHGMFDEIYSSLLTSLASGKPTRLRVRTDDPTTPENEGDGCVVVYSMLFAE